MMPSPTIEDFLAVAEAVLEVPIERLLPSVKPPLAESALNAPYASFEGQSFYPDPVHRAAILASRIIRNHALPDGNKRTALLMMLLELDRIGATWRDPPQDEIAEKFEELAASTLSEADFAQWVADNTA